MCTVGGNFLKKIRRRLARHEIISSSLPYGLKEGRYSSERNSRCYAATRFLAVRYISVQQAGRFLPYE